MSIMRVAVAAAAFCGFAATGALAQSTTTIPFGTFTRPASGGGDLNFDVSIPASLQNGSAVVSLTYAGDVSGNIGNEVITLDLEVISGNLQASVSDCVTQSDTVTLSTTDFSTAAADGTLSFSLSFGGGVGRCGGGPAPFVAPFAALDSDSIGFAIQGEIEITPSASSTPTSAPLPGSAESQVATVAGTRGAMTLLYTPDPQDRIDRLDGRGRGGAVSYNGIGLLETSGLGLEIGQNALAFSTGALEAGAYTFWSEGAAVSIHDGAFDDGTFYLIHLGVDRQISDRALVGLGLQIDRLQTTDAASGDAYDGVGWMFGPYTTVRLRDSLHFDGRLALGQADTEITGAGAGDYTSDRGLVELRLTGETLWSDVLIEPYAELNYYIEESDAFGAVAATETDILQSVLGGRVSRDYDHAGGVLTPYVEAAILFSDVSSNAPFAAGSYAAGLDGMSAELELGTSFFHPNGTAWSFNIRHHRADGVFSTGLWVDLTIPF